MIKHVEMTDDTRIYIIKYDYGTFTVSRVHLLYFVE